MRVPGFSSDSPRNMRLTAERVYLRSPRLSDWRDWASLREESRAFLVPWEPTWPPDALSNGAFRRRVRAHAQEWRDGTGYSFLIFKKQSDCLVGGITLSNLRRGVSQCASLGYWCGAPHARQGYVSEALAPVLDFTFGDLSLNRIEAACLPSNEASHGLLHKVGFREEGFAKGYLRINGQWRDHVLFAMLREEWRQRSLRPSAKSQVHA